MFGKKEQNKQQLDLECFTIYDSKTSSYDIPYFAVNHLDVIRQISNLFSDPQQAKNKFLVNAEDYSVFSIGSYCKKTGTMIGHDPKHVINLHELRSSLQLDNKIIPPVAIPRQEELS